MPLWLWRAPFCGPGWCVRARAYVQVHVHVRTCVCMCMCVYMCVCVCACPLMPQARCQLRVWALLLSCSRIAAAPQQPPASNQAPLLAAGSFASAFHCTVCSFASTFHPPPGLAADWAQQLASLQLLRVKCLPASAAATDCATLVLRARVCACACAGAAHNDG